MDTAAKQQGTWRGDLAGGATATILALPEAIAFGALTFGVLGPALVPAGIAAGLLTLVISNLVAGPIGGVCIMHLGNYSLAAVMMGSTLTFIATGMGLSGELTPAAAAPVITVLMATILLAGAFQVLFGALRLGVLTKYIPHPVLAGLFNGTAVVMLISQLAPMLGLPASTPLLELPGLLGDVQLATLTVGLLTCAAIAMGPQLTRIVPVPFIGMGVGSAAYYLFEAAGVQRIGPVIGAVPAALPSIDPALAMVDLAASGGLSADLLVGVVPYALGLAVIASLRTLLTCITTDELLDERGDSSRELVAQGIGNLGSAAFGGVIATGSISRSAASHRYGSRTARSRVLSGGVALLVLLLLGEVVGLIPEAVLAAMLVMLSLSCFDPWSLRLTSRILRAPRAQTTSDIVDWLMALTVAGVMVFVDVFLAIGIGVVMAMLFFAVGMGRSIIRRRYSGRDVRANVQRPAEELAILAQEGDRIRCFELEGALFFGTADRVAETVEAMPADAEYFVILDLQRVGFLDATGRKVLSKLTRTTRTKGSRIAICAPRTLALDGVDCVRFHSHLDALLWAEDALLDAILAADRYQRPLTLDSKMDGLAFLSEDDLSDLRARLPTKIVRSGDHLFRQGDPGDSVLFLLRGRIDLVLDGDSSHRLATLCPGTVVGEMGLLEGLPRSAAAVARGRVEVQILDRAEMARLETQRPDLVRHLLTGIAVKLSDRLRLANAQGEFFSKN